MCRKGLGKVDEKLLIQNAIRTSQYITDALKDQDYESLKIEMDELQYVVGILEDLKHKTERRKMLFELVEDMQKRGMKIGFAKRSPSLNVDAKNAAEKQEKTLKIDKKRQHA